MRGAKLISRSIGLLIVAVVFGCNELPTPKGLELQPAKAAADSVMLEVFLVRLPADDEAKLATVWAEIDEMALSAELRQRLKERGFRGGMTGGRIPLELERLMELAETPNSKSNDTAIVDFEKDSKVSRRVLQMRPAKRGEILASPVYERLSLFEKVGAAVEGRTYQQAQCCFAVSGVPQPDGHVRLRVESEVQYGDAKMNWGADEVSYVVQMRRANIPLDGITIEAELRPGQLLMLGSADGTDGSIGDYFFRESTADGASRRLVLVRLAQSRKEPLFAPAESDAE